VGCRKIVKILEVFAGQIGPSIPHHTTVRQWIIRHGCHSLQSPLEKADDWISIGDLTISVGKLKCLVILGVRMTQLDAREDLTLSHKDVEVIGLYPTTKSNGKFVEEAYEDGSERIGGNFLANILDQGSDIKKGARLFQQSHSKVKLLHDISHKLSNVMEHELRNDKNWSEYIQELNMTRKRAFQTELSALMPKKQREKARFMDIGYLVNWPDRIKRSKENGHLESIPEERYQDYLGWIDKFTLLLDQWKGMVSTVQLIKETVRKYGYSRGVYRYLKMIFDEASIEEEYVQKFILKCLRTLFEEVEKLDDEQTLIGSTEVIESVFGKYKAINEGLHGITGNILGICTFVGREKNVEEIKKSMENCSVAKAVEFVKQKFGQTLASLRKQFFPGFKWTKFDDEKEVALMA
jgi:hypothetical protein